MKRHSSTLQSHPQLLFLGFLLLLARCRAANETDEAPWVNCTLCEDPTHTPQYLDSIFKIGNGDRAVNCSTAYDLGALELPVDNCTFWQNRGSTICNCGNETPSDDKDCTLCPDGRPLPYPRREGRPGKICAQLQADANWDVAERCPIWQYTVGFYCGCFEEDTVDAAACRLCGSTGTMSNPLKAVFLLGDDNTESTTSCGELEFSANLPGAECDQFQTLYRTECCMADIVEESEDPPGDGAVSSFQRFLLVVAVTLAVSVVATGW